MILKILSLSRWQKMLKLSNDFQACGVDTNPGLEKKKKQKPSGLNKLLLKTTRRSKDQNSIESHKEPSPEIRGLPHITSQIRPFGSLSGP